MFPYLTLRGLKIPMTGLGIVVSLIVFIVSCWILAKRYQVHFWTLFYRIPQAIVLMYLLGVYVHFVLKVGIVPSSRSEFVYLLSPYEYKFHFIGLLLGLVLAIGLLLRKIVSVHNKKIYIDILFFSFTAALVPLGIFLLLGDNFIGNPTTSSWGVQALHPESSLNKFTAVLPIGLFMSIGALIVGTIIYIVKKLTKQFGWGLLGCVLLLIMLNIVIVHQQYPRYGIITLGSYALDIKQYVSACICLLFLFVHKKRNTNSNQ